MPLAHLIYISRSRLPLAQVDGALDEIGACSYRNNRCFGLTGLLLYNAGHFLQLLEGDELAVLKTYDKIAADPRHEDLQRLIFQPTDERIFSEWEMGVMNLDRASWLDQRRFIALAAACRNAPGKEQLGRLYGEFRRQLPAGGAERPAVLAGSSIS